MKTEQIDAALLLAVTIAPRCENVTHSSIAALVARLSRNARSLHKRFDAECSHQWAATDKFREGTESLTEKAKTTFRALNAKGVALRINHDPRGWPLVFEIDGREYRLG